jgi:hypothetical protein
MLILLDHGVPPGAVLFLEVHAMAEARAQGR